MRQRVEAAIDGGAKDRDDSEQPQQARHRQSLALIPLVPVNGTEYDHVRPKLASHLTTRLGGFGGTRKRRAAVREREYK
jgi:hypothetical protein